MPDQASINRSLNTIRTELEFLQQSGAVAPAQFQSIMAQLPVSVDSSRDLHISKILPASITLRPRPEITECTSEHANSRNSKEMVSHLNISILDIIQMEALTQAKLLKKHKIQITLPIHKTQRYVLFIVSMVSDS